MDATYSTVELTNVTLQGAGEHLRGAVAHVADKHFPRSNNTEVQAKNQDLTNREARISVDRPRQHQPQPSPLRESWGSDPNKGGLGTRTSISANDQDKSRQQHKDKRSSGLLGNFVKKASSHPQGSNGADLRRSGSSSGSGGLANKLKKRSSAMGPLNESP